MTLIVAYLLALIFLVLIPLLLTLWTALKKERVINKYFSNRDSEMINELFNMQKTIEDHGKEIKKHRKGRKGEGS